MTPTSWGLFVVSSEGQRESLGDYLDMARADAARQGWTLERTGDFVDVSSGKEGVRKTTARLIAALAATPPEARPAWIWMRRIDRVGRGRAAESMLALFTIHDLGVRIWDHDHGEVHLETAEQEMVAALKAGLARMENQVRSGKAKAVYAKRRAAGAPISNRPPLGLRRLPNGYEPQEPHAEVIRTLFRLRLEGKGYGAIAQELLAVTPPFRFKNGREIVVRWTPQRVQKALTNRAYVGTLVDEVTFERARRAAPSPSRAKKHAWPLAGCLRCACGRRLTSTTWGNRRNRYRYYVCRASWVHGKPQLGHRATRVEAQFVALLARLREKPELVEQYRQRVAPETALLQRALAETQAKITDLDRRREKTWTAHESGHLRTELLQERLDALAAERESAERAVAEIKSRIAVAEHEVRESEDVAALFARAPELYAGGSPDAQQRLAKAVGSYFGGLCVETDGRLTLRAVEDPDRQTRRARA